MLNRINVKGWYHADKNFISSAIGINRNTKNEKKIAMKCGNKRIFNPGKLKNHNDREK